MEKYGTDMLRNLIEEETRLMRNIATAIGSSDKTAGGRTIAQLEQDLSVIRNRITEIQLEEKPTRSW